jgi:hypothetical protein
MKVVESGKKKKLSEPKIERQVCGGSVKTQCVAELPYKYLNISTVAQTDMYGRIFSTVSGSEIISLRVYIYCVVVYLNNLSASQNAVLQIASSVGSEQARRQVAVVILEIYLKPTNQRAN